MKIFSIIVYNLPKLSNLALSINVFSGSFEQSSVQTNVANLKKEFKTSFDSNCREARKTERIKKIFRSAHYADVTVKSSKVLLFVKY